MKNIDFNAQMNWEEFINLTNDFLYAKDKAAEIERYCGDPLEKDSFVKPEYFSNQNELDFIEPFASKSAKNKKVITFIGNAFALILRVLCLIGFIVFLSKYPAISGEKIDDGGFLIIPFIFLILYVLFKKSKLLIAFIVTGIVFPVLCALAAIFASEATGKGDTACIIAYFTLVIPAILIPFLTTKIAIRCADHKLYNSIEYIEGLKVARELDEKEAERLRKEDEKRYQDYLEEFLERRAEILPRKEELIASVWGEGYERLYKEWEGMISFTWTLYPNAIKGKNDREFIRWCLGYLRWKPDGTIFDFLEKVRDIAKEEHERIERSIALAGEVAKEFSDLLSRR